MQEVIPYGTICAFLLFVCTILIVAMVLMMYYDMCRQEKLSDIEKELIKAKYKYIEFKEGSPNGKET